MTPDEHAPGYGLRHQHEIIRLVLPPAAGIPFLIIGVVLIWVGKRNKWTGIRAME
jgi:hypothetical protein